MADDEALGAGDLRSRLRDLIAPFDAERGSTRVAEIRRELGHKSQELARLLKTAREAEWAIPPGHAVATTFTTLNSLAAVSRSALPATTPQPFGPSWQGLIDQPDRAAGWRVNSNGIGCCLVNQMHEDTMGRSRRIAAATYDPGTNRTTLTFANGFVRELQL